MDMNRINRQIVDYIKTLEKKVKQMNLIKNLKKEVNIGANGTQKYVIKNGVNKGKVI